MIQKAKNREISGYTEKHHIIPKCLGGSDDESNLVKLTAREHFIAHQLLAKLHPDNHGLVHAAKILMGNNNSRKFEWLRKLAVETSIKFHTGRKRPKETCERISKALKGKRLGVKFSEDHRKAISKGRIGIQFSKETCEKLSNRVVTDEWRRKNSEANKGRKPTKECLDKQAKFWNNPENKAKYIELSKQIHSIKVKCQHCGKECSRSNFARWHGDNCKVIKNGV